VRRFAVRRFTPYGANEATCDGSTSVDLTMTSARTSR